MTAGSDALFGQYLEAQQKFDYFVTGVAIAMVGFLGARFEPTAIAFNPSTVELGAIAALMASAWAGLKGPRKNNSLDSWIHAGRRV